MSRLKFSLRIDSEEERRRGINDSDVLGLHFDGVVGGVRTSLLLIVRIASFGEESVMPARLPGAPGVLMCNLCISREIAFTDLMLFSGTYVARKS